MNARPHRLATLALLASAGLALAGCTMGSPAPSSAGRSATPSASASTATAASAAQGPAVPGYRPGEIPPLPLFTVPNLAMLDQALGGFSVQVQQKIPAVPGVTVAPAACGDGIVRAKGASSMVLNGDGSGVVNNPDGSVVNNGDGSGTYTLNGTTVVVNGDGSGVYSNAEVTVVNNGDGSGTYNTATLGVVVNGDGSGTRNDTAKGSSLVNNGDGSGTYSDRSGSIVNNGDGSGTYSGHGISIVNNGDGTGLVNSTPMKMDKVPPAAKVGKFPPMGTVMPIQSCGTTITLDSGVLFDFDKDNLRPDAASTIDALAAVLKELGVPAAEVSGHTDSIGTEEYNQGLSERRAASVVAGLRERGVATQMTAVGYGETAPVAPNEINGQDNPAGRQLNRRVEIYIPAF